MNKIASPLLRAGMSLLVVTGLGCESSTAPATAPMPMVDEHSVALAVWPADVASLLLRNPPPIELALSATGGGRVDSRWVSKLEQAITVVDPDGQSLPISFDHSRLDPVVLEQDVAPRPSMLGLHVQQTLGRGWHEVMVDLSQVPELRVAPGARVTGGGAYAKRFNVASAPTVRRLWVCPTAAPHAKLRLELSEPVVLQLPAHQAVRVLDTSGAPLPDCPSSNGADPALDGTGEHFSTDCGATLPGMVRVEVDPSAFRAAASGETVLGLDGLPFRATLQLDALPRSGGADCRVYVP